MMRIILLILPIILLLNGCAENMPGYGSSGGANIPPTCNCEMDTQVSDDFKEGILTKIVTEIKEILDGIYEKMYIAIAEGIAPAATIALIIYVAIFGIMFSIGAVQLTTAEAVKRVIKLVIIAALISPGGFALFNTYVVGFFRDGVDDLIEALVNNMAEYISGALIGHASGSGTGYCPLLELGNGVSPSTGFTAPFQPLDILLMNLISPRTLIIFEAAMNASLYGLAFLMLFAGGALFLGMAVARALWVYLIAMLAMTLLLGLAPIFIVCLLFQRTQQLFNGWLSQMVNFTLQPVLMFTFLGFFVVLLQVSLKDFVQKEVCLGSCPSEQGGQTNDKICWQFTDKEGETLNVIWKMDGGYIMDGNTPKKIDDMDFPIEIMPMLIFLLIGFISWQFYDQVIGISQDISGAFIDLETGSPVQQGIQWAGNTAQRAISDAFTPRPPAPAAPPSQPPAGTNQ